METDVAIQKVMQDLHIEIKEHSFIGRIAAWKLNVASVAIVVGRTIHLHNVSKESFLKNRRWVKHELCHVRQYKHYGNWAFIAKYLWESVRKGYYNNKFEVEARSAELHELPLQPN
jgi:hypothetical protein